MWMEVPTYSSIIQFLEYGCVCGMQIHQEIITHPTYPHMAWLKKQPQHKISNCSGALLPQVWPILRYCTICYNFGGGEPPFGGTLEPLLWSQDIYIYISLYIYIDASRCWRYVRVYHLFFFRKTLVRFEKNLGWTNEYLHARGLNSWWLKGQKEQKSLKDLRTWILLRSHSGAG